MKRTYLALTGLALAGFSLAGAFPLLSKAGAVFGAQPVDPSRYAVLARPLGTSDWNLVVLEQPDAKPDCWETRSDGLIDPSINRVDVKGMCGRYSDSNGYSLRIGEEDLGTSYRLRVQRTDSQLQLQAISADQPGVLLIGKAELPKRARDAFVALKLEPGWELRRRQYGEELLQHIYFTSSTPLGDLLAATEEPAAAEDGAGSTGRPMSSSRPGPESDPQPRETATSPSSPFSEMAETSSLESRRGNAIAMGSGQPVPIEVIPYRE